MVMSLPKGVDGSEFDFTYDARDSEKLVGVASALYPLIP